MYKRQIKEAKERLQNASNRQVFVEEVIENKKKAELELVKNTEESGTMSKTASESIEPSKLIWTKLRNELIFRRRFMLFELYSIYFTDRSSGRRKERNCNCEKFDMIRGLHLPACNDRYEKAELELVKNTEESGTMSKAASELIEPSKLIWTKLRNELIFRRRFMLFELYSIYFTDRSSGRRKERNCNCEKFDMIRGLHLPACNDRYGHNEIEITAALGHLTNILLMIGRILNYNFFSPMFFKSSKSFILERNSHQIFLLFDITSRSHRERFVHAYFLLNRNIIQLRRDLGLNTIELDRPIQNLQDAILCAIGKSSLPCTQIMRCLSIHSPSIIIPLSQNIPQKENNSIVLKNTVKLRSRDDNILDVVSAKNDTFDVEKLCSRSLS
uniref:Uncharacterized protein n=1 Tax=Panagrolaimus sp. ES5 TaxID=591445 RepID=A0AC34FZ48_9BILA